MSCDGSELSPGVTVQQADLLERAARRLCEIRGRDPDEQIPLPHAQDGVHQVVPRWLWMADEVQRYIELRRALAEVGGDPVGQAMQPAQRRS